MKTLPDNMTIREAYGPAMEITDQQEANEYFEALVESRMKRGKSRQEAESIERQNLGYFAGYCNDATREQVERLFNCTHPIFGSIAKNGAPTASEAFDAGKKMAGTRA